MEQVEDVVKVAILVAIAGAGLAASFTHMHDWTMRVLPAGTPDWFGWANAVISELLPLAGFLTLRKRLRDRQKYTYPMCVLLGGALLSLGAQLAAVGSAASVSAKFLAVLPALAFMVLSKMVLGDLDAARKQAARRAQAETEAAQQAEILRDALTAARDARAHAEAETAAREQAEIRAHAEAETVARQSEQVEHLQAEIAAVRTEMEHAAAVNRAAADQSEAQRRREVTQAGDVARRAREQAAEATASAERAEQARVVAEQELREQAAYARRAIDEAAALRQQLHQAQTATARRGNTQPETVHGGGRKLAVVTPQQFPLPAEAYVPHVEKVRPETAAVVVAARAHHPDATQAELSELTGISDRTIRKVLQAAASGPVRELTAQSA